MMQGLLATLSDDECKVILNAYLAHNFGENESVCQKLVSSLTLEEQEIAARTSYAYWLASMRSKEPLPDDFRIKTAMREACRHMDGKGDFKFTLNMLKKTIAFRVARKIEIYRTCLQEDVVYPNQEDCKQAAQRRSNIRENMGIQTMVVRGHDRDKNAILLALPRKTKGKTKGDCVESFLDFVIYMIERVLACTEVISLGQKEKIVVILDAKQSSSPCIKAVKAAVWILQNHYPNRLKNLVIMDPPCWMAGLYNILKPLLDPETRTKFIIAKGEKAKEASFRLLLDESQAMPNMLAKGRLATPVCHNRFLNEVPFHCLYDFNSSEADSSSVPILIPVVSA